MEQWRELRGSPVQQDGSLAKRQLSLFVNFARNRPDLPSFSAGQEEAEGNAFSFVLEASIFVDDL